MIISIIKTEPVYQFVETGTRRVEIPCTVTSYDEFFAGFYDEFEKGKPPSDRAAYSIPIDLQKAYNEWKIKEGKK